MTSKATPQRLRLARFIAVLALDPDLLQAFFGEPKETMAAAGLDEEERTLLLDESFLTVCRYLPTTWKPLGTEQPPDGQ